MTEGQRREGSVEQLTVWRRLLAEPARPVSIAARPNAHWYAVGTVCIGAFMGQLDASIVTLALPTIAREFHASLVDVEWVSLTYLLVLVSAITVVGRLADMTGRKLLYLYGFLVFTAGSALCGLAPNLLALDGARIVQAIGAAMLQANSVALIVHSVPERTLSRAIGIQGAAQAIGLALGPAIGGLLIALGGWRLIFFVNVPVGILGTVLGWFLLPRSRDLAPRVGFDWLGASLFVPAVAAFMAALAEGSQVGWGSPTIVVLLASAAGALALFVAHERRCPAPMVDLGLFRRPHFSAGIGSGLLSYTVMFGILFVVPFYLEGRRHLGPAQTGLTLTALPAALAVVAPLAGRLADRIGPRPVTIGGMVVTGTGLVLLSLAHHETTALLAELALVGSGLGAFIPANNAAIMRSAPRHQAGVAAGILNMTRGFGTSLGVAVTGLVYSVAAGIAGTGIASDRGGRSVAHGFTVAAAFLAMVAVLAALVASARSSALPAQRRPTA